MGLFDLSKLREELDEKINLFIKAEIELDIAPVSEIPGYVNNHWPESFDKEVISTLSKRKIQLETSIGIFDCIDFEPLKNSLTLDHDSLHHTKAAIYKGPIQFWVEVPKEIIRSRRNIEDMIRNSDLLLFDKNLPEPQTITLERVQVFDYDLTADLNF